MWCATPYPSGPFFMLTIIYNMTSCLFDPVRISVSPPPPYPGENRLQQPLTVPYHLFLLCDSYTDLCLPDDVLSVRFGQDLHNNASPFLTEKWLQQLCAVRHCLFLLYILHTN